ncbi:glycosyltransferase [Tardiphaga sp.]|uniref:glycosyltransferase n=1 Tax=Tardiphaga sp. TaxID=1926292 RepID=UPI00261FB8D6|nr:glycosyltransferase [Tardiphaga sp.]MDB5619749.1 putative glycosyltransferase [Tardiphaga sp.]
MAHIETSTSRRSLAILMGTWNGAEHLDEQLQSFADQTHSDWSLHVSDDGSSDATRDLVTRFAATVDQPVEVRIGPKTGFVDNFLTLARDDAIDATYFAFSDQDDIWYPDKLARALAWFETVTDDSIPAVYFSRTELITSQGLPRGHSTLFRRPAVFRNALVQNIGGANTMVFNRAARRLLQAAAEAPAVSHDWALYLLVTAVDGIAYYDSASTLKYRQHDGNVMGSNRGVGAVRRRLELMFQGTISRWNAINRELLRSVDAQLSAGNRETLRLFSEAGSAPMLVRLWKLKCSGVYRQTWLGNLGLALAALIGKI